MPPRPSQNLDRALIAAGLALYPSRGCAGLTVREVAEAAGVNLGMFHYHFKTREAFLRAVLQEMYEGMYSQLTFEGARADDPLESLKLAVRFMGRFLRANRALVTRLLADVIGREPVAVAFAGENVHRHLGVVMALVIQAQKAGVLKPVAAAQVLGMLAGATAMPILFGGAIIDGGALGAAGGRELSEALLSDAAIDERIDLVLAALAAGQPAAARKAAPKAKTTTKTKKKAPP